MESGKEELSVFIAKFNQALKRVFHEQQDINELSHDRGLPPHIWRDIMETHPLAVAVPTAYGGRGSVVKECLSVLSAASYESLPLSLTFGINIALFLEPLAKYGDDKIKEKVFPEFLSGHRMGGLMITEPEYGSDALNMRTSYRSTDEGYAISGRKRWQGFSGQADCWLVAARRQVGDGDLARDVDVFVTSDADHKQHIKVEQPYTNLGLSMSPDGLNTIDLEFPPYPRLQPES